MGPGWTWATAQVAAGRYTRRAKTGGAEIARVKMWEWTRQHEGVGVDIIGVDNVGVTKLSAHCLTTSHQSPVASRRLEVAQDVQPQSARQDGDHINTSSSCTRPEIGRKACDVTAFIITP